MKHTGLGLALLIWPLFVHANDGLRRRTEALAREQFKAARAEFDAGRYERALEIYRTLRPLARQIGREPFVCKGVASALGKLGKQREALDVLDACVKLPGKGRHLEKARQEMRASIIVIERRLFGELRVTCEAPGVELTLNDRDKPVACPASWRRLAPDAYALTAWFEGREYPANLIEVEVGRVSKHRVPPLGRLTLKLTPASAAVRLDDKALTPPFELRLPPGDHRLEIRGEGLEAIESTVSVESGGAHRVIATLRPQPNPLDRYLAYGAAGLLLAAATAQGLALYADRQASDAHARFQTLDASETAALDAARTESEDHQARAVTLQWAAVGLVGGAALLGGLAWWLSDDTEGSTIRTAVGPGHLGVVGRW